MNHIFHEHETSLTTEPPHLYGRWRRDPLMRVTTGLRKVWFPLFAKFERVRTLSEDDGMLTLEIIGRDVVARDDNVIALTLAAPNGAVLPQWHPGAHLDLHLDSGRMRSYSLCGDPGDRRSYRIAVRRIPDGGGGSIEVHDTLNVGDTVSIRGPRNAFPLALPGYGSSARTLRFVAAGIGITPILPMLAMADRYGLEWTMIYCGRSAESIPFIDELARYGDKVTVRTDDVDGLPTMDELVGPQLAANAELAIYTCGPVPMLEGLRTHLAGRGDIELHFERFSPPPILDGTAFDVTLNSTGETITVAADESVLTAIRAVRPGVPYSCQQGFCGTCKMLTTSGDVDHRDGLLTEPERAAGYFLPCVSRCDSAELAVDA
ncbi:PDR/VanB family oxidoreductase [Gordonia alkaliphila]|uniref:PDR/VanB family oxidoreductase n=1 Tax=Gordonia alkaliphila TaxID=1053547 RepID=A0ABP8ZFD9_9ACTN|nr:PDR/VanB family oxidoreductase [Gordonia alkaliphila]MCK0439326.1 PDR/VanB family oxidoreductase [Gordonia alkaliphila]